MTKRTFIRIATAAMLTIGLTFCKKDTENSISTQTISGKVYNLCTDSGLANITVYLLENGSQMAQVNSGAGGNFTFANVKIHSADDYHYELSIPGKSGIGSGPEVGLDGVTMSLDKSKLSNGAVLGIVPRFKTWSLYYPNGTSLTIADTFTLIIQQNLFHQNVPSAVYQILAGNSPTYPPPSTNFIGSPGNYPMGSWESVLDKVQNGVHVIKRDTFYLGYGAIQTDTIQW